MQLVVNFQRHVDPPFVAAGGVGEIYRIGNGALAKVFFENKRTFERRQKVLALCNSFQNHVSHFGTNRYAFPEQPAYELTVSFDTLAGFSMRDFGSIPTVAELGFDLAKGDFRESKGVRFNDSSAIDFIYQVFEWVDSLHRARIILGDVNDGNVLYSPYSRQPVIVDIDSAQIGQFCCLEVTEDFMAPELKVRGSNLSGSYIFDSGTDIFAIAVVCYEFLIGAKPHFICVDPPKSTIENKDAGVSSLRCFSMGQAWLKTLGLSYVDVPENRAIERRLAWLQSHDRLLFDFFVSIFVKNERNNLLSSLPVTDARHPGYHFLTEGGFKRVIDDVAQQRARAAAAAQAAAVAVAKQPSAIPDSGFRGLIAELGGAPSPPVKPAKRSAAQRAKSDPPELAAFLGQFNLTT
jgi:serine/threonine protein kinase